jgi:hypothetical protein
MANEQGQGPGIEAEPGQEQHLEGTIRIQGDDGEIYFLRPDQLKHVGETQKEIPSFLKPLAEVPPPEGLPPAPEAREPITDDAIRELSTQIIAFNVENYDELNATNLAEAQQKFNQPARRFFEQLVVHGSPRGEYYFGIDAVTDNPIIFNTTDLDGRGAVALMRMAGVDTSKIEYVKPGSKIEGKTNLDTGDQWGLAVALPKDARGLDPDEIRARNLKATIFIDHHGEEAQRGYSATKGTYEVLTRLGMLEKTPVLDKTVDFITMEDNGIFPFEEYERSDRILAGLAPRMRFMGRTDEQGHSEPGIYNVARYAADNDRSIEQMATFEFDEEQIRDYGLERVSREKRAEIEGSQEAIRQAHENGFVVESPEYGKVIIDIGRRIDGGWRAIKCPTFPGGPHDTLISWEPRNNGFYVNASRDFDARIRTLATRQGVVVRERMWLQPQNPDQPLLISLPEILAAMAVPLSELEKSRMRDGRFNPRGLYAAVQREEENRNVNVYGIARPPGQRR